ncbi:MAG: MotA/TolQ/ExbB proton channel family protein [Oscillospiraceae bacterium]|nr:MotA/TolQ/ExbB proton channel family protein [Oscillospiraceae bacterium]
MAGSLDENFYIIINAAVAAVTLVFSVIFAKQVEKVFFSSEGALKKGVYYWLDNTYTLFLTLISIFPLLGMFGTVKALLELDMSQDLSVLQQNFFSALTSTAWGIIFSVIFKIVNSFFQPFIENQISNAKADLQKRSSGQAKRKSI